ncbi:HAAS signaling domain-containing protein [Sphingobacterium spiritivorum]|uniref:HAAS signaling domain-containing protein n=1 Tax=Sphingobacterium spiritivorum TaxID=258 RepID=UPI003DA580DB
MKFKKIAFKDKNSKRIYLDYISRIQQATKSLDKTNQQEVLLEINSHIYESIADPAAIEKGEVERLLDVLEKLGQPEIFLKPLVAEKKLEEATKSFNPFHILKALILNIGNGISYVIFTLLYLLLFGFIFLIGAKLVDPENVGFFFKPNEIFILGYYRENGISYLQYEQLGHWFIPAMLLLALIFYVLITLLLRLKRTIK